MPTLAELSEQEARLQFDAFDNLTAWELGTVMRRSAVEQQLPIAIEIRRNGQLLFHAALAGTGPDNDAWLMRKARVVDRYGVSSLHVGERARHTGATFEEQSRLDPDLYAAHGGAFPVTLRGTGVIGTVAVSGLPQVQDHEFVVSQLALFLGG